MTNEQIIPPHSSRLKIYFLSLLSVLKKTSHKAPGILPVVVKQPFKIDKNHLAEFKYVCGFQDNDEIPITYPFVLSFFAQMTLMTHKNFPVPVVGLIHIQNKIRQIEELKENISIEIKVSLASFRKVKTGRECELKTAIIQEGKTILESESFYLYKVKKDESENKKLHRDSIHKIAVQKKHQEKSACFSVPSDIGKQYAKVSGDYNPIHLTDLTARLFGFQGVIAHGMWSKSKVLASLKAPQNNIREFDVLFKKPIFPPCHVSLFCENIECGENLRLTSNDEETVHLQGNIVLTRTKNATFL